MGLWLNESGTVPVSSVSSRSDDSHIRLEYRVYLTLNESCCMGKGCIGQGCINESGMVENNMRHHWSGIISAMLQLMHGRRLDHVLTIVHHGPGQTTRYDGCGEAKRGCAKEGCKDAWKAM